MKHAVQLAERFGHAIVRRDFRSAHTLLAADAQKRHSAADLEAEVDDMIEYAEEPLTKAVVLEDLTMADWPDKQIGDLGWVYVSLEGEGFGEAVTIVVTETPNGPRIRELEWGRP